MTTQLTGNPMRVEGAATIWDKEPKSVRLIQWVDDAGDLVHDSTLVLTLDGCALTVKIQPVNDGLGFGAVAWQIGPFNPGIIISSFISTTQATGHVHIWVD